MIHFGVVRPEERYLAAKFGDPYRHMRESAALRVADLTIRPTAELDWRDGDADAGR